MKTTQKEEMEKRFEEEISGITQEVYERLTFADYPTCETSYADNRGAHKINNRIRNLKSFLQSEIARAVAEEREKIITTIKSMEHCGGCAEEDCTMSAQEAYEEVLSLITKEK